MDDVVFLLVELLKVSSEEARAETVQCHGAYVQLYWLRDVYQSKCDITYITHVHVIFLNSFRDLMQSGSYACGVTTLVHMHENLNDVSKSTTKQLAGYITFLQCWIYEHFPSIGYAIVAEDYNERKSRACRWKFEKALPVSTYLKRLDKLTLMLCTGFHTVTIVHSESLRLSLYFSDISDKVYLLSYIDRIGLYDNLGMCSSFLHTL
ncbi:hypothetical protein HKD37_20G056810 [Glycine soja]